MVYSLYINSTYKRILVSILVLQHMKYSINISNITLTYYFITWYTILKIDYKGVDYMIK